MDIANLAASLCFGIAKNHAFADGNKRTALIATYAFLQMNGHDLRAEHRAAFDMVMSVAASEKTEAHLADWLRDSIIPREDSTPDESRRAQP